MVAFTHFAGANKQLLFKFDLPGQEFFIKKKKINCASHVNAKAVVFYARVFFEMTRSETLKLDFFHVHFGGGWLCM